MEQELVRAPGLPFWLTLRPPYEAGGFSVEAGQEVGIATSLKNRLIQLI